MAYKDPEARRAWARAYWHRVKKGNPKFQRRRTEQEKAVRQERYGTGAAIYKKEYYHKNRERLLAYAKQYHDDHYVSTDSSKPGSIRYEAKLAGYKSGFERSIAANLKMREVPFEYETVKIPYVLEGVYNPDFVLPNGVLVEAKGVLDRESKRKMEAVKRQHPEIDIRFLFMAASKRIPGMKMTHAKWAEKYGFPWAEGTEIPDEWLKF